jgi:hypothetical protein
VITHRLMPHCASSFRPWPSSVMEGLEGLALLADVEPAVGQHAVDIEERQPHADAQPGALGAQQQLGREVQAPAPSDDLRPHQVVRVQRAHQHAIGVGPPAHC